MSSTTPPSTTPHEGASHAAAPATGSLDASGSSAASVIPVEAPLPASTPAPAPAGDAGMATAEYAIATLAACGFAALLVTILASDAVRGLLLGIVQRALSIV